jgi:hypothetical protein
MHTDPCDRDLLEADAVELVIPSFNRFERAAAYASEAFTRVGRPTPPIFVRVNTFLAANPRSAVEGFEKLVRAHPTSHTESVRFVGTCAGLLNFIRDLAALQLGAGVSITPLEGLG